MRRPFRKLAILSILATVVPLAAFAGQATAPNMSPLPGGAPILQIGAKMQKCQMTCDNGQVKKWQCAADQVCCANTTTCQPSCGSLLLRCF
jgi:hypothetical protein